MNINLTKFLSFFSLLKKTLMDIKTGPYIHIPPMLKNYEQFVKENYNNITY